jgi:hypothetical protein
MVSARPEAGLSFCVFDSGERCVRKELNVLIGFHIVPNNALLQTVSAAAHKIANRASVERWQGGKNIIEISVLILIKLADQMFVASRCSGAACVPRRGPADMCPCSTPFHTSIQIVQA